MVTNVSAPSRVDRFARAWLEHDSYVYAAFALACAAFASSAFYGYMLLQTKGAWSAPLDDVFIHFDYARSFARGYPFQWTEGNGYSSGNTSLSYPVVLALGYAIGFRGLFLMVWAAVIAHLGVFVFLHQAGKLVDDLAARLDPVGGREHAWIKYLFPPTVLSLGALDWTLWSGMENAWHLGVWGLALGALVHQVRAADARTARHRAWLVGAANALLVATRPESAICAAAFGFFGVYVARRDGHHTKLADSLALLLRAGLPPVLLLVVQALANRAFTGEYAANGAIAKLLLYHPFMDGKERWNTYLDLLRYIVPRLLHHHFAEGPPWGYLPLALALAPLANKRLRPMALFLWVQVVGWLLLISVNMQVRWQNERYAMPAAAWMFLLAAMGLGLLAGGVPTAASASKRALARWTPLRLVGAVALAALYWHHQEPRMRDQIWFFGRASRNIFDQQLTAGYLLERLDVKRVLVGDAGALLYASDRAGIDLIGLGGYHRSPFARSTLNGLGATLEQIERIPVDERPDTMAIYPSWWGDLPIHFGRFLAAVPVVGNVICGGAEKVLYRTDWSALDEYGTPRSASKREVVVDELDLADLVSEKAHAHDLPRPGLGFVKYRVLADPLAPERDLFDAGRIVPPDVTVSMRVRAPRDGGRLLVRLAPDQPSSLRVVLDGAPLGTLDVEPSQGRWVEVGLELPAGLPPEVRLEVTASKGEAVLYHLWTLAPRGVPSATLPE